MTLSPPDGLSVYDIVHAVLTGLPLRVVIPANVITEALNRILSGVFSLIIQPILNGITVAIDWIFEQLGNLLNASLQAIVNALYVLVINPLKVLVSSILNRFYEKLEGVIFIAITVPAMVIEARNLIHRPSPLGILLFMFKPMIGSIVSKVVANTIKPMLKPVVIEPSIPPTIEMIPKPKEVKLIFYESVTVDDIMASETVPPMMFRETVRVEDAVSVEAVPPMTFLDYIGTGDTLNLEIIPPLPLLDSIEIDDVLTVEIIPPLELEDSITVEDTLIIWGE